MPRQKCVSSLKQACLNNVAVNMEKVWAPKCIKAYKAARRIRRDRAGDFDQLPPNLIRDILHTVREKDLMKKNYLQFFLVPQLDQLDLSLHETDDDIMKLIGNRCKSLKKLVMCWNVTVKVKLIEHILVNTPRMTTLNLAGTKTNDHTLQTIAKHCPNLKDLDVSDCFEVTDAGVGHLCPGQSSKKIPCPNLLRLNLTGTKVGRSGVIRALKKLRSLQYLEHEWLWEILSETHTHYEPGNHVSKEDKFQLRKMIFLGGFEPMFILRAVDIMCGFCPWLSEISIFGCGFDDQCLFRLSRLKHLKKFRLDDQRNMVTFRWGLLPFFHACGESLEMLSLINVKDVNVAAIAAYCPNLEVVNLVDMSSITTTGFAVGAPFRYLKRLEVRQHQWDCSNEDALRFLLAHSCDIEYISFYNIVSLTDMIMNEILDSNQMTHLERLSLCRCHGISADTVIRLIHGADMLRDIHLRECNSVTINHKSVLTNFIKENKLDVHIY